MARVIIVEDSLAARPPIGKSIPAAVPPITFVASRRVMLEFFCHSERSRGISYYFSVREIREICG
jgi:hypothetical protein